MLMIRLRRAGTKGKPFYRVVVSDSRLTPQARVIETLGHFDPKTSPEKIEIDLARTDAWINKGARASDTVLDLLRKERARTSATTTA